VRGERGASREAESRRRANRCSSIEEARDANVDAHSARCAHRTRGACGYIGVDSQQAMVA
jgi:hypothetical protein